ncbi:MAG TPA: PAAR domain-containing protein [Burkholderiaceae bacterium]|nr:PAAR domain-containing protein [Burkholderiaceae bacterium]
MSKPFIVVGDRTSHGGTVVEGSPFSDINGRQIARVGDKVTCPRPGHGTTTIATGDPTCLIDGKPAARHGDTTACGAALIASQTHSTLG